MLDAHANDPLARIEAKLSSLREKSQFRSLEIPAGVNLCSNDYLGLAADPRLKQALLQAIADAERIGSTGSRLISGNSRHWEEIESEFADFAGTESALYFGSGYAANVGLLSSILQPGDIVFSDALNHASLIDGIRLSRAQRVIYPHCDLYALEQAIRAGSRPGGSKFIVTESIFSMEGDIAPLTEILQLMEKHDAYLIVDEAHAVGVYGEQGRGLAAGLPNRSRILATVYPCGKALASIGAFVCCGRCTRDFLVNHARSFIFSTATPPYIASQIRAALSLARAADDHRTHLMQIASALRTELSSVGLNCGTSTTQIVPIILGSNEAALQVAAQLQSAGFAVKAIRPPSVPPGAARIRLSLTRELSLEQVHSLARGLYEASRSILGSRSALAHA